LEGIHGERNLSLGGGTNDGAELLGPQQMAEVVFRCSRFHTFGGRRDFNPMVLLFRPFRRTRVLRFLPAFQERKRGNNVSIEQLRRDLVQALGRNPL
jgi:hypothetical protein